MQQDYDPKHTRNKMRSILYLLLFTLYIFYLKLFDVWQILKQTKKNQEKYKYFSLNYQVVTIQLQTAVWFNFSAFF